MCCHHHHIFVRKGWCRFPASGRAQGQAGVASPDSEAMSTLSCICRQKFRQQVSLSSYESYWSYYMVVAALFSFIQQLGPLRAWCIPRRHQPQNGMHWLAEDVRVSSC